MDAYRADRVVRTLTAVVSTMYYLAWVAVAILLIGLVVSRLVVEDAADASFWLSIPVPMTVAPSDALLASSWDVDGPAMAVEQVRGEIRVPVGLAPGWLVGVTWLAAAVLGALILLFLHHLRRLFQRIRQGAPFDPANAIRLRWLGVLLLAFHLVDTLVPYWLSVVVTRALEPGPLQVGALFRINGLVLFIALVLVALAEIFRRGAALEDEQSLVV